MNMANKLNKNPVKMPWKPNGRPSKIEQ